MKWFWSIISALVAAVTHASAGQLQGPLYINYSPAPRAADLLRFKTCILDPAAQVEITPAQSAGHVILAYISAVEVAQGSPARGQAAGMGIRLVGENSTWKSAIMDVTQPAWQGLMNAPDGLVAQAANKGFDGFFFDTVDSFLLLPKRDHPAAQDALVAMLLNVRREWPKKKIIINRGFELLPYLKGKVDAVLVESVYQTYDFSAKKYTSVTPDGTHWLTEKIQSAQKQGFQVLAVDYVHPVQHELAKSTAARLAAMKCLPLVTTPELRGKVLAPARTED